MLDDTNFMSERLTVECLGEVKEMDLRDRVEAQSNAKFAKIKGNPSPRDLKILSLMMRSLTPDTTMIPDTSKTPDTSKAPGCEIAETKDVRLAL